jgi:hypothetical protein
MAVAAKTGGASFAVELAVEFFTLPHVPEGATMFHRTSGSS